MSSEMPNDEGYHRVLIPPTPGHKDSLPILDLESLEAGAIDYIRRHAVDEQQVMLSNDGRILETFPYYARVRQDEGYVLTTWDVKFTLPPDAPVAVLDAHYVAQLAWLVRTDDPKNPMSSDELGRFGFALGQAVATFGIRQTSDERLPSGTRDTAPFHADGRVVEPNSVQTAEQENETPSSDAGAS